MTQSCHNLSENSKKRHRNFKKVDFAKKNGGGHEPLVHQRFEGGPPRRHQKKHIVA